MEGQRPYLTKDHERLLNYAVWSKYLAWAVLAIFCVGSVLVFIGEVNLTSMQFQALGQQSPKWDWIIQHQPTLVLNWGLAALRTFFQGLVYFLVLKGISLGLSMIAETDVNYRDRKEGAA